MPIRPLLLALLCVPLLAGCTQERRRVQTWSHPDATQDQFMADRETCLTEARQQKTTVATTGYANVAGSRATINPAIFTACMGSRHYIPDDAGPLSPTLSLAPASE